MMSLWEERAARNEALFREVNERIEHLGDQVESGGTSEFVCECADGGCTERIMVPLATYERIRRDPYLFVVAPGHELPELDQVVEPGDRFVIVRKDTPTSSRIAEQTDPRS
jgi:hypothetical protein